MTLNEQFSSIEVNILKGKLLKDTVEILIDLLQILFFSWIRTLQLFLLYSGSMLIVSSFSFFKSALHKHCSTFQYKEHIVGKN